MRRLARLVLLAASALAVSGCASTYLVDNQVQSFSQLSPQAVPLPYRFERSLSQNAADPAQSQVEALADPALHAAGFRRNDAAPRYSVQVSARTQRMLSPYADPWWPFGWNLGFGHRGIGIGIGGPLFPRTEQAWFQREVSIIVRDLATNRVVYETHARHDGPWLAHEAVLPAMFTAALQGFPVPPQGVRRVDIPLAAGR